MKIDMRNTHATRDGILKLLSDAEIASVSMAETAGRLADGAEYIDLANLDEGVRRAFGPSVPMARVLPRNAVREDTWKRILAELKSGGAAT